jgi:hypothetical protein
VPQVENLALDSELVSRHLLETRHDFSDAVRAALILHACAAACAEAQSQPDAHNDSASLK